MKQNYYKNEQEKKTVEELAFPLIELYNYDFDDYSDISRIQNKIKDNDVTFQKLKNQYNLKKMNLSEKMKDGLDWIFDDILKKKQKIQEKIKKYNFINYTNKAIQHNINKLKRKGAVSVFPPNRK